MDEEANENSFEVIVGTYEEFLLGYKFNYIKKNSSLTQSFATHDHSGSIRTVSKGGRYVATGSADDRICVYDMKTRREQSILTHHSGTVNYIAFTPNGSHLLTGGQDGTFVAVRTGNWQLEKVWTKAHGGTAIQMIAIHPTGKLALTLGLDNTLRTWNLVKGRQAYVVRLDPHMRSAHTITWSPDEKSFLIYSTRHLELWNIEVGGCQLKTERKSLITSVAWINSEVLCIGHETGEIAILDNELNVIAEFDSHKARVKCLEIKDKFVISADSTGKVYVWKFKKNKLIKCAEASAGCRITCMCIIDATQKKIIEKDNEEVEVQETEVKPLKRTSTTAFVVEEYDDDHVGKNNKSKKKSFKNKKKKV